VGSLFFFATFLGQGGAVSNGQATAILAGTCVVVLVGILLVARRARVAAVNTPSGAGGPIRTTGFVVGILLIELTQITSLPGWARVTCGLGGTAAIAWALLAMRRARRG